MALLRRRQGPAKGSTAGRRGPHVARRGGHLLARLVMLITSLVVGVIVLDIVLVVLEANTGNALVEVVLDVANFLVGPFENVFDLKNRKTEVAVNCGLAALVYFIIGSVIARLLRR